LPQYRSLSNALLTNHVGCGYAALRPSVPKFFALNIRTEIAITGVFICEPVK